MKKLISLATALLMTASVGVSADEGKRWERMMERNSVSYTQASTDKVIKVNRSVIEQKKGSIDGTHNTKQHTSIDRSAQSVVAYSSPNYMLRPAN